MNLFDNKSPRQYLIAFVLIASAMFMMWHSYEFKMLADASLKWTKTDGTIESSKVNEVRTSRTRTFDPNISYRYSFENQTYTNTTISFPEPSFKSSEEGDAFISDYPARRSVSVYVNPKLPSQSCLVAGETGPNQLFGPVFSILLAVVIFVLPSSILPRRRNIFAPRQNPLSMIEPPSKSKRHY